MKRPAASDTTKLNAYQKDMLATCAKKPVTDWNSNANRKMTRHCAYSYFFHRLRSDCAKHGIDDMAKGPYVQKCLKAVGIS